MHPAEHRGLRELHASARQLRKPWRELDGACAARGLHGRPAAQGLGSQIAGARLALVDPTLEVGQAAGAWLDGRLAR